MMNRLTLPKSKRLASNRQFRAVMDQGYRAGDRILTIYAAPNSCGYPRLGVSVGRASGDAVVRNRLKRLMREAFRLSQDRIQRSFDYVVMLAPAMVRRLHAVASPAAASMLLELAQVQASFLAVAQAASERVLGGRPNRRER
jgi:ribonuclease P protein component